MDSAWTKQFLFFQSLPNVILFEQTFAWFVSFGPSRTPVPTGTHFITPYPLVFYFLTGNSLFWTTRLSRGFRFTIKIHPLSGWYFSFGHSHNTAACAQVRFLLACQPCNCYLIPANGFALNFIIPRRDRRPRRSFLETFYTIARVWTRLEQSNFCFFNHSLT